MGLVEPQLKKASEAEVRNVAAISSSFLPAFGVKVDEDFPWPKKYVIAPFDRRYRRFQFAVSPDRVSDRVGPSDQTTTCWSAWLTVLFSRVLQKVASIYSPAGCLLSLGIPFELAFEKVVASKALITIDLVVDTFFAVDIVVSFFIAYLDKSTQLLVFERKKIAARSTLSSFHLEKINRTSCCRHR